MEEYEEEQEKLHSVNDKLRMENQNLKMTNHKLEQAIVELQVARARSPSDDGEGAREATDREGEWRGNAGETCDPEEGRKKKVSIGKKKDLFSYATCLVGDTIYWVVGCFVFAFLHVVMYVYWKVSVGSNKHEHLYLPQTQQDTEENNH